MTVEQLEAALLVGALVVLVAALAVRWSARIGLPSLVLYLGLGFALHAAGITIDDPQLARSLGFAALVVILAEGGLTTRWSLVRPAVPLAAVLATVGVLVTAGVVGVAAHLALGLDWRTALLLGAVLAPTDAAAVFATLRRLPLRPQVVSALEAESGLNDAPAVLLVVLLATTDPHGSGWQLAGLAIYELVMGAAVGLAIAQLGAVFLPRAALPASGLYPLATVAHCVIAFAAAGLVNASGFLAVYAAGVRLGNADLPHRRAAIGFAQALAWLAQIGLFVLLGLLVEPRGLAGALLPAVAVGAALLAVARPAAVLVSATPFRLPWREQAFLSWAGLRGAVPIVLATIPLASGSPRAEELFDIVVVLVLVLTLVQEPALAPVARRLGVVAPAEPSDLEVESAPLEELGADLVQLRIPARSRLNGVEVGELRLPRGANVTLVVREGRAFVPTDNTTLQTGDAVLVVATTEARPLVERRLRAVSRGGRLAGWTHGGGGRERGR